MKRIFGATLLSGVVGLFAVVSSFAGSAAEPAESKAAPAKARPKDLKDAERRDVGALFKKFDQDSDGALEKDEVPANVWRRVELADTDGDGRVSLADLAKARGGEGKQARKEDARPGGVGPAYEIRVFQPSEGAVLRYGWLAPKKLEEGKNYPLVVCLHGRGGNTHAADVLAGDALREKYPTFVMAPECNQPAWWARTDVLGRGEHPERLPEMIAAVRAIVATEAIDPARVYITGQSMGGVGSWAAAARYPELFAAAVPVCGAWSVDEAPNMVPVPIWAFHGSEDGTVPVKFSRELTAAVTKAGGTVKYTEYEGVGHGSWDKAYADAEMWKWMFEQRKAK